MGAGWGRRGADKRNDYGNEDFGQNGNYIDNTSGRNDNYKDNYRKDKGFCAGRGRRDVNQNDDYNGRGNRDSNYDGADEGQRLWAGDQEGFGAVEANVAAKDLEDKQYQTSMKIFMIIAPLSIFILMAVVYALRGRKPVPILLELGCWTLAGVLILKVPLCKGCSGLDEVMTRSWLYRLTGILCVLAICCGVSQGLSLNDRFFHPYWTYLTSPSYTNVLPSDLASARYDAAIIGFDSQAVVDTFRSGSSTSSDLTTFCVAPIFDYSGQDKAEFWAVGTDCCGKFGGFYCDDALDSSCKSGLVLRGESENSSFAPPEYRMYMSAVKETAAREKLQIPDRPVLLRWSKDVEVLKASYFTSGIAHLAFGILFYGLLSCCFAEVGDRMEKAKQHPQNLREQGQMQQQREQEYW